MMAAGSRPILEVNAKCQVCCDLASGYHYGVNSCEGCKGFFRRCITQGINFSCTSGEKCQVTPFTRNSCQYCRLKKCFEVGMSREASRLGRRPKKTMKGGQLMLRLNAEHSSFRKALALNTTDRCSMNEDAWDYQSLTRATLSDMFGNVDFMSKMGAMMSSMGHSIPQDVSMPGSYAPTAAVPYSGSQASAPTQKDLEMWRIQQLEVMSRYMHNKDNDKRPSTDSGDISSTVDTCSLNDTCSSGNCQNISQPKSSDYVSSSSSPSSGCISNPVSNSYDSDSSDDCLFHISVQQSEKLDQFLTYSLEEVSQTRNELITEAREGIIASHMEHCFHLRPRALKAEADIDFQEMTGQNVLPPNGFWIHFMSELSPTIERVVRFLKNMPGFLELEISDQILLIKRGAFSVIVSQAVPMIDPEKDTMLDPQLKYRTKRSQFDGLPRPFRKVFDDMFILAGHAHALRVTDEETGLLNAILTVNSVVDKLENSQAVTKLEKIYVQALHQHLLYTLPEPLKRLEQLLRLIALIENISESHARSLHSIKYNQEVKQFPPLHKEVFLT